MLLDEELDAQLDKFPTPEEVEELVSMLGVTTLRDMAAEIVNASIEHTKGNLDRLAYAKLINGWIATAEEMIAAGRNAHRISARRRKPKANGG